MCRARHGPDAICHLGRNGSVTDLKQAGFLGPLSLLVAMTGEDPEGWIVSFAGRAINAYCHSASVVGFRFIDLPLGGIVVTGAAAIAAALPEQRAVAHRVHGRTVDYECLLLPVAAPRGIVNRFIIGSDPIATRAIEA